MPRGDRTGPMGMGAMSGRSAGYCGGYDTPGFLDRFLGQGFGFGQNRGGGNRCGRFGWRNMFRTTGLPGWMRFRGSAAPQSVPDSDVYKKDLEDQIGILQSQLDRLRKRKSELDSRASEA